MGVGSHSQGVFITGGVAEIAKASTIVDGVGFTSNVLKVWDVDAVMVQADLAGEAGANGDLDFVLVGSVDPDGVWDTVAAFTLTATLNGATIVRESLQIDVRGYCYVKLYSIQNKDASKKAITVNLRWGKAYGYIL